MTQKHQTQQEITAQLADITETMQREKIKLSPEVSEYLKTHVQVIQGKLMKGEPIYPKDMKFIKKVKAWMNMPENFRKEFPSIEMMGNGFKLSKEQKEKLLQTLKKRFKENQNLHVGLEWQRVKTALEGDEKALWSINEMENAGHEPDVYYYDEKSFDIGTCSKETPLSSRYCLCYKDPEGKTDRCAEEMAEEMGIELMTENQYMENLQKQGWFDNHLICFLKTPDEMKESGYANHGYRVEDTYGVIPEGNDPQDILGWRGSMRVRW